MVWLGACFQDVIRPAIMEEDTLNADRYIDEVPLIALEDGKV